MSRINSIITQMYYASICPSRVYSLELSRLLLLFLCSYNVISFEMSFLRRALLWTCVSSRNIKVSVFSTPQHSLCSSDPSDQSCTADPRLLTLFILILLFSPPPRLLPSSLLPSLLHCLFFLLCHCSSIGRWADASVVRGNTSRAQHLGKHAN